MTVTIRRILGIAATGLAATGAAIMGAAAIGALAWAPPAAHAADDDLALPSDGASIYVAAGAGLGFAATADLDSGGAGREAGLEPGVTGVLAAGHAFGNGLRSEIELGWRGAGADDVAGVSAAGDIGAVSGMLNTYYGFDLGSPFRPFVGAGIGAARVEADGVSPVGGATVDDSDTGLALQGIVGVQYRIEPRWSVTADYRYFAVPTLDYADSSGAPVDAGYASHAIVVGLRFDFGAPGAMSFGAMPAGQTGDAAATTAAAPAAAPAEATETGETRQAAAAPRTFRVFFDWDSAEVLPDAEETLREAARVARAGGAVSIEATGHADRSGPDDYNMKLSKQRAMAVKRALVRHGVAPDAIALDWRGETQPLVPTADGVAEPQNRRVEISLP